MLIDTHCHLTDDRLSGQADEIISSLEEDGIESVITVGYDEQSSVGGYELALAHSRVYAAVGLHPHDSKFASPQLFDLFSDMAVDKKVVAIGEIGLDYYYDYSPRDTQRRVFAEQLELAHSLSLPVVLHIRDAYEDARKILFDNKSLIADGLLLHCYSGSAEMVKVFSKLDAYFSFGGAITFKNAVHNIESLHTVSLDRLVLETDAPYMTPVPFRGKTNFPKYVSLVRDKAAEVLSIPCDELSDITTTNAKTLFKRLI